MTKIIFENSVFSVVECPEENSYKVFNKSNSIIEEVTSSMYDAMMYARINENLLQNFDTTDSIGSWPGVGASHPTS